MRMESPIWSICLILTVCRDYDGSALCPIPFAWSQFGARLTGSRGSAAVRSSWLTLLMLALCRRFSPGVGSARISGDDGVEWPGLSWQLELGEMER